MLVAALLLNYNVIGFYFKGLKYNLQITLAPCPIALLKICSKQT
jgi:hypothetical protein